MGDLLPYTEPTSAPYPGRDCRAYGWDGAICLDDARPFHPWPKEWEGRTPGETWVQFARYRLGCAPNGKDCDGREVTP